MSVFTPSILTCLILRTFSTSYFNLVVFKTKIIDNLYGQAKESSSCYCKLQPRGEVIDYNRKFWGNNQDFYLHRKIFHVNGIVYGIQYWSWGLFSSKIKSSLNLQPCQTLPISHDIARVTVLLKSCYPRKLKTQIVKHKNILKIESKLPCAHKNTRKLRSQPFASWQEEQ